MNTVPSVEMKTDGLKAFNFEDLEIATNNFTTQIGQGEYGKVYKGTTTDGSVVAIKRAHQGSLQGAKSFTWRSKCFRVCIIVISSH